MSRFSEEFLNGQGQGELDFVDVPLDGDFPLFLDPFAISLQTDEWSRLAHEVVVSFFQAIIDCIRAARDAEARELLSHLQEPNETRLGYSQGRSEGAGIGRFQSEQLFRALFESEAARDGFITSLQECELMIDGISFDKISDLTTNVLRKQLAEYTKRQCELWSVPMRQVALPPYFDHEALRWRSEYFDLPTHADAPILLVPKLIARRNPSYDHRKYYKGFVIEYLRVEALQGNGALVRTLKSGAQRVYKKDVEAEFPCSKTFLFEFSRQHPEVLQEYREELERLENSDATRIVGPGDERLLAEALIASIRAIPPGTLSASSFHRLMIGCVEFIFFPNLVSPKKEMEVDQGRKRIDIFCENASRVGIFNRLSILRRYPCSHVSIECKNYSTDVGNPELDQLAGRLNPQRGKVGILLCRSFERLDLFIDRCRDTFRQDRGLIFPLDDARIIELLNLIYRGRRADIDIALTRFVDEVWVH